MKTILILLCILVTVLTACKKKVEKDRSEFIGDWYKGFDGGHVSLSVDDNSHATYTLYSQGKNHTYKGTARANNKKLSLGGTKYFDIIEYPHRIDTASEKYYVFKDASNGTFKLANWKMVLNGLKPGIFYEDGIRTLYKADY